MKISKTFKLYYPEELFDPKTRRSWFELIKSRHRLEQKENQVDREIQSYIEWSEDPNMADAWILPMDWNYYYSQNRTVEARAFCEKAHSSGKKVLSFTGGDFGITMKLWDNVIVYRNASFGSRMLANERITPFYLSDPYHRLIHSSFEEALHVNGQKPVVGFCGTSSGSYMKYLTENGRLIYYNIKKTLGLSHFDYQKVISSSRLRHKALCALKENEGFSTNYLIRSHYRGGANGYDERMKMTYEYYQNQVDSDLNLCARGIGNFTVRFYETLAVGRIPIHVDTDSVLPNIGDRNWDDYIIRVDHKEIDKIADIALRWLEGRDLKEQLIMNRKLWLDFLRLDSFWKNELLKEIEN